MAAIACSIVWIVSAALRSSNWNQAYLQLARQLGAAVIPSGWFGYPLVRLHHVGGERVRIGPFLSRARSRQLYTQVQIDWHDAKFQCEIYPRTGRIRPRRLANVEDTFVSSPHFNSMYQIRSNDSGTADHLLNETVQWQIETLRRYGQVPVIHIYFNYGRLIIAKPEAIRDGQQLATFVELALSFYDQITMTRFDGIDFVETEALVESVEANCMVCGDDINEDLVYCTSCRTPHHRECWLYYGACSTYGCQETTFQVPQIATKVHSHPENRKE